MRLELIVKQALELARCDGLFNEAGDCACLASDLAPCGSPSLECRIGVKRECDCGDHDFHVVAAPEPIGHAWVESRGVIVCSKCFVTSDSVKRPCRGTELDRLVRESVE